MQSLHTGKRKTADEKIGGKQEETIKTAAKFAFVLGAAAAAVMTMTAVSRLGENQITDGDAVYTFSYSDSVPTAVREELRLPERVERTSGEGESIFDCIGEMFAELIFGGRGEN